MNTVGGASSFNVDLDGVIGEPELALDVPPLDELPTELGIGSKKCKQRNVSLVWTQFDKVGVKNDDGTDQLEANGKVIKKACCRICNGKYVFGGTHGTNHLRRHMSSCLKRNSIEGSQPIVGKTTSRDVYYFSFSQKRARYETVRYFVREELPFNKVDKPSFHRWVKKSFGPQFRPPCRQTMRDDVIHIFGEEKSILKGILKDMPGKISLTSDLWTSKQKLGYMCVTAHYISSDWRLNKRILSFPMLPSPHSGKSICKAIKENMLGWDLCGKIGTITLDNATNNDLAVGLLKDSFFGDDVLSGELFHMRCNAHVINLLVKAGLKHVNPSLVNIRESILHIRSSPSKIQKFHKECKSLNIKGKTLPVDIETRWDSTYLMLEAAIPYEKVFDRFFSGSKFHYIPNHWDWMKAIAVRDFFKLFWESTKLFSGTKYVTSSLFCFQLSKIAMLLKNYGEKPCYKDICTAIKKKYDKYWKEIPLVLCFASCMDPRYKLNVLGLCLELNNEPQCESVLCEKETDIVGDKLKKIKEKLAELFEVYAKKANHIASDPTEIFASLFEQDDMVSALLSQHREASIQTYKSDLQRYLDQPPILNTKNFDLLGWWKAQESMFPVLSTMARDLLTIPITTVPSEAAFSVGGRVVSKNRSSLKIETVEALMCLRDWYQAEEGLQDEDVLDIEDLMSEEPI